MLTLALAVLVGLSACQKGMEDTDAREYSDISIRFACESPLEVSTRANSDYYIDNERLVQGRSFVVNAWDTGAGFLTADPGSPDFMTSLPVLYQNNRDKGANNTYTPVVSGVGKNMNNWLDQFWPRTGADYHYSFCAYYPYNADPAVTGITPPTFPAGTVGQYVFAAKTDAGGDIAVDNMVDFCVSDVANDQVYGHTTSDYSGTVKLNFRHTLTRVRFKFLKASEVSESTVINLVDAQLLHVKTGGTLTATYAQYVNPATSSAAPGEDRWGTTTLSWDSLTGDATYEMTLRGVDPDPDATPDPVKIPLPKEMDLLASDIFLMVPQAIVAPDPSDPHDPASPDPDAQAVLFKWSIGDDTPTETLIYLSEAFKNPGDATPANISWGTGESVTYTIVIRATPIQFADSGVSIIVSVAHWPDEDVNGYYQIID